MLVMADSVFSFRLLNENPVQRLGATGATEVSYLLLSKAANYGKRQPKIYFFWQVKRHAFFKDINWDTLARQKVLSHSIRALICLCHIFCFVTRYFLSFSVGYVYSIG